MSLQLFAGGITAETTSRTIAGPVVKYGVPGRTNRGMLKVRPGALYVVGDVSGVKLTKQHLLDEPRGHAAQIDFLPDGIRAAMKVADGPEGDDALREAQDKTRDGFSFHILDEQIVGDEIVSGRLIAIGQVGIPAYDGMRIDSIAAALHPTNEGEKMLTDEERARLSELIAKTDRTPEEETEFQGLAAKALQEATAVKAEAKPDDAAAKKAAEEKAAADKAAAEKAAAEQAAKAAADKELEDKIAAGVAASLALIPGGVPNLGIKTSPQGENKFDKMISGLVQAFQVKRNGGDPMPGITAALNDVTSTANTSNVEPLGWSGELFSGLPNEQFFDIYETGPLENWEGKGWRFTQTPAIDDYAGDKAEIPTGTVGTQESLWEAARGAVGIDIDRKYFDFPNGDFLNSLFTAIGSSWLDLLDEKRRLFTTAQSVEAMRPVSVHTTNADATVTAPANQVAAIDVGQHITGPGIPANATVLSITNATTFEISANATATADVTAQIAIKAPSLLKAAARVGMSLNRPFGNTKRPSSTGADWLLMNDEDHYQLLDLVEDKLPAYLTLFGVKPEDFRASPDLPRGVIYGGVKKAAKVRTESRSPIAIDALNLANGGIDKAFFGYWAIEQQHLRGVQKVAFSQVVEA